MLNNSARNCTLKFSEIRVTELFLNTEKSRFVSPGPIRMLRPALPRRLRHWKSDGSPTALAPRRGSELHIGVGPAKNEAGAVGPGWQCESPGN